MFPGCWSPRRITPRRELSSGLMTETVFENCSAAYTRSWLVTGMAGPVTEPGAWPGPVGVGAGGGFCASARGDIEHARANAVVRIVECLVISPLQFAFGGVARGHPHGDDLLLL